MTQPITIREAFAPAARRILVTGADGFLGRGLVAALARQAGVQLVLAMDLREVPGDRREPGVRYVSQDVRDPGLSDTVANHQIDTVVHLASIVTPAKGSNREFEHSVDVGGTKNVLDACVQHGVHHLVVSSSGAAYGYHVDNPEWLTEQHALRGNQVFAYAHHKLLVEEMLSGYRKEHPALQQTVLRIGTILGERVDNQITALFDKPRLIAIRGSKSPFVFIWDEDVVGAILHAIGGRGLPGCYNLAGDGALTIHEIAERLGKPIVNFPAWLLRGALSVASVLGVSRYGPEQIDFLRYRPVLLNTALKQDFGFVPLKTSSMAFNAFVMSRAAQGRPVKAGC
ncbi:MAG: epimerase [Betaproteobacteria bacterium HGW-Betaproteobacteria-3]|jgi:UDP-glucose 4-epimerase|nr:MAG: epimerase [Betaproteobacteria bacterium HGW-Betaproteobacteria-3]